MRVLITMFIVFNIFIIQTGYLNSENKICVDYPSDRLSILIPTLKLGCWLGKPLGDKND